MNDELGPPLDPLVLAALREEPKAPDEARARARSRLALAAAFAAVPRPSAKGGGPSVTSSAASGVGSHAVTVIAFLGGGVLGAFLHSTLFTPPPPQVVYLPPPISVATAVTRVDSPIATAATIGTVDVPAARPPPAAISAAPPVSQLDRERAMLDLVRAQMVAGNTDGALERLKVSRHEFPRAVLDEEREALTVEALVAAHHYEEARAAAEGFRRLFPGSLFTPTVEGSIRSIP